MVLSRHTPTNTSNLPSWQRNCSRLRLSKARIAGSSRGPPTSECLPTPVMKDTRGTLSLTQSEMACSATCIASRTCSPCRSRQRPSAANRCPSYGQWSTRYVGKRRGIIVSYQDLRVHNTTFVQCNARLPTHTHTHARARARAHIQYSNSHKPSPLHGCAS